MAWIINWAPWSNYSMWRAHRIGVRHGRQGIPELADVRGEGTYIDQLRHFAEELASGIREEEARLEGKQTEIDRLEQEYRKALKGYNEIMRKYSAEFRFAGWSYINRWVYMLLALLILIGEIPLNTIVFRLFGEAEILNFAVALGLGILILIIAHFVGIKLKYIERTQKDWWMIVAGLFFVLGVLIPLIGFLRHIYFTRVEGTEPSIIITYAFIAIQYLIFWGAVVIAYAHHYPAERRKMEKQRARWLRAVVSQQKERAKRYWDIQQSANSIDRLKDVYIGANLAHRNSSGEASLVFYLTDFDDYVAWQLQQHQYRRDSDDKPERNS